MKLRKILQEISFDAALKVLNIDRNDLSDETKLKSAFRTATISAHPDKGGSTAAMQDVNDAYELLKKNVTSQSSRFDWEKSDRENLELGLKVRDQIKEKFNTKLFVDHFSKIYSDSFQFKILRAHPKETDKSTYSAGVSAEFFNNSRDIVFSIDFHCSIHDVKYDKSLGSGIGNVSYPLGVSAYGFFNNKKLKITQRDYTSTRNHDVLSNPELSFPKAKLEKFKTTSDSKQFKRADMILYLTKKIGFSWDGQRMRFQLPDRIVFAVDRGTFMKTPYWSVSLFQGGQGVPGMRYVTMDESVETAKKLEKIVDSVKNMNDGEEIKRAIKSWTSKMKEMTDGN